MNLFKCLFVNYSLGWFVEKSKQIMQWIFYCCNLQICFIKICFWHHPKDLAVLHDLFCKTTILLKINIFVQNGYRYSEEILQAWYESICLRIDSHRLLSQCSKSLILWNIATKDMVFCWQKDEQYSG